MRPAIEVVFFLSRFLSFCDLWATMTTLLFFPSSLEPRWPLFERAIEKDVVRI